MYGDKAEKEQLTTILLDRLTNTQFYIVLSKSEKVKFLTLYVFQDESQSKSEQEEFEEEIETLIQGFSIVQTRTINISKRLWSNKTDNPNKELVQKELEDYLTQQFQHLKEKEIHQLVEISFKISNGNLRATVEASKTIIEEFDNNGIQNYIDDFMENRFLRRFKFRVI